MSTQKITLGLLDLPNESTVVEPVEIFAAHCAPASVQASRYSSAVGRQIPREASSLVAAS